LGTPYRLVVSWIIRKIEASCFEKSTGLFNCLICFVKTLGVRVALPIPRYPLQLVNHAYAESNQALEELREKRSRRYSNWGSDFGKTIGIHIVRIKNDLECKRCGKLLLKILQ